MPIEEIENYDMILNSLVLFASFVAVSVRVYITVNVHV